ncbi:cytochrome c family protein [Alphaproteobacteria bacterium]|nr:cytochrome c family protein [Alphaproteobacteria bacterium]
MDELRLNKVFAGFLFAALLLMAGVKIADVMVPHQELAENAYVIEVAETTDIAAAAPVDTGPEPILALLAGADLGAGEKLSKKCSACHIFDAGGQNKVGPALWNVVNRPLGASEGYAYSDALAGFGGAWDYAALNAFLAKPKGYISGTKMNFAGLKKPQDRANLIAWMRAKADSPVALPSADDIAAEGAN